MRKKQFALIVFAVLGIFLLWISVIIGLSWHSVFSLRRTDFEAASRSSRAASVLFWPIRATIGAVSADMRLWGQSLELVHQAAEVGKSTKSYFPAALAGETSASESAQKISASLPVFNTLFADWLDTYSQSKLFPALIEKEKSSLPFLDLLNSPDTLKAHSHSVVEATQYLLSGKHRLIFLLQNSDELRATGGFMGSYAILELQDGVVTVFEVQDIYVPDGQFTGVVEPPPGVKEYLSGGKGWRLPDANWSPDFPTSAQEVMKFLALGKENQVEAVIAVNDSVIEDVLAITGWIYLPDYDQTVTSENLADLARADRSQFFPGSQQKKQFLDAVLTNLKIRLTESIQQKPREFIELIQRKIASKDIQAFSNTPALQQIFTSFHATGAVNSQNSSRYFYLIESNVGINKANRLISRDVALDLYSGRSLVLLSFRNENPVTSLKMEKGDYINYQRILVPVSYQLQKLIVLDKPVLKWDEEVITTSSGEKLKQIGFLVTLPAKSEGKVLMDFTHPLLRDSSVLLQKQSGLSATPYQIIFSDNTSNLLLEKDTVLTDL